MFRIGGITDIKEECPELYEEFKSEMKSDEFDFTDEEFQKACNELLEEAGSAYDWEPVHAEIMMKIIELREEE